MDYLRLYRHPMKTLAYLRISTDSQDLNAQKLAILNFAQREGIVVDAFIETTASAGKPQKARRLDELMAQFDRGDRLVVSELSRLGRSLGQVIEIVDTLVKRKIAFIAVKENIRFEGKQNMQTKVMVALFALFAEVERDLISERTKEGLAKARASGKKLGRPKGALGKSRLNGKEEEIQELLEKDVSKTAIAKIIGVSRTTLYHFIQTRHLNVA
jgi:DNA invertase Pin-like site-specific DNA recombinase